MYRWLSLVLVILACCTGWAQTPVGALPSPDFGRAVLPETPSPDPERPHWIDATPIFDDMAQAAAKLFKPGVSKIAKEGVPIGGEETFWAMNIATKQFERVPAILKRIGKNIYLYVEKGRELEDAVLDDLITQWDGNIYPTNTKTFGSEPKPGIDGDDRVTLLLLDIKDGWEPGKGYVGGYFFPLNEYSVKDFPQSNEREMIYLDLNPSNPKDKFYMGVVAHEFQHLIHFNQDPRETKWINEGGSQYAFRACGFGHPNQIMAYTRQPDHNLADWQNTIDDYGCVYLFFYYLYQKYPGVTGPLTLAVTSNVKQGIESIDEALTQCGLQTTFAQIWKDWTVANILSDPYDNDGKWGYDETLPVKVLSRNIDARLDPSPIKDTVQPWAVDYLKFDPRPIWQPIYPTPADIVSISLVAPGFAIWSIDDGIAPPKELWPPDTRELEAGKSVITKCGGSYPVLKVGPFTTHPVKRINFSLFTTDYVSTDHGQIRVDPEDPNLMPNEGTLYLTFQGKKGGLIGGKPDLNVRLLVEACSNKVYDVPLDADLKATKEIKEFGTQLSRVTLLVGNTGKKAGEYELTAKLNIAPTLRGYLGSLERGTALLQVLKPQMTDGAKTLEPLYLNTVAQLGQITAAAADLLDPAKCPEAAANAKILAEMGNKPAYAELFKQVSEKRRFAAEHGETWNNEIGDLLDTAEKTAPAPEAAPAPRTRPSPRRADAMLGDDADTSHTNINYLCNKKQELIHGLTHLKIDPTFVEGQILQMYKLLQINLNLPNIPLPDGLGLVNYNEQAAQAFVDQLRAAGDAAVTPEEKDALRRLTIYEDLTERLYNGNLTMAEDFGTCTYEAFRLVLSGRKTLLSISSGLADIPFVGNLTQKVVRLIIAKSIGIVTRTVNLLSVKMKPPYSTIVPIVVQIGGSIAAKYLHVPTNDSQSWMWPWAAKTAAKYALASVPKLGYVARTQALVEAGVSDAVKKDFTGSNDAAVAAVLDDGNPDTANALAEVFALDIAKKHTFIGTELEVAQIAKAVAQIAGYATLIDPTNISKVVGIVAASVSGGAIVHGMVGSVLEFSRTRDRLAEGLVKSFHPDQTPAATKSVFPRVKAPAGKLGSSLKLVATLKSDYLDLMARVKKAYAEKDLKALSALTEELAGFEEAYEPTEKLCALSAEAALAGTAKENDLDAMTDRAVASDLARTTVLAALLPSAAGTLPGGALPFQADAAAAALGEYLTGINQVLTKGDDLAARVGFTQMKIEAQPTGWQVSAVATLIGPDPAEITFTMIGADGTTITKAPGPQVMKPWDSVPLEWTVAGPATAAGQPITLFADSTSLLGGCEIGVLP